MPRAIALLAIALAGTGCKKKPEPGAAPTASPSVAAVKAEVTTGACESMGGTGFETIGGTGDGWGAPGDGSGNYTTAPGTGRGRPSNLPTAKIGTPQGAVDLDVNIVRRYLRQKLPQLSYCYEKQLLVKPTLAGTVETQFAILGTGAVKGARASGVDPEVADCVRDVISNIQFPKPKGASINNIDVGIEYRAGAATEPPATSPSASAAPALEEGKMGKKDDSTRGPRYTLGPPSEPEAAAALATARAGFEGCYATALGRDPALIASMWLELERDGAGTVTSAVAYGSGDEGLERCAEKVAQTTKVPGTGGVRCALTLGKEAPLRVTVNADARVVELTADGPVMPDADGKQLIQRVPATLPASAAMDARIAAVVSGHRNVHFAVQDGGSWVVLPGSLPIGPDGPQRAALLLRSDGGLRYMASNMLMPADAPASELARVVGELRSKVSARAELEITADDDVPFSRVAEAIRAAIAGGFTSAPLMRGESASFRLE